jgi:hypothetical protein
MQFCRKITFWCLPPRGVLLLACCLGLWGPARGQAQPQFEASSSEREVVEGAVFEVAFTLKNAQGNRFKAPDFKGFRVLGGPSEMRGMSIVNGQSSSHQRWSYTLEALKTGNFSIPAATVQANGKTLSSNPITVRVVSAQLGKGGATPSSPPPGGSGELFLSAELSSATAYPGQQVNWRIRLYTQVSIEGADIIELPDFKGFLSKEKRRFDTRVQYQTLRGKKYAVKTLHEEALFAQGQPGMLDIGPASVRVMVEQPGAFGMLLGGQPRLLQTQPLRLELKPLPQPQPEGFGGVVGQYEWTLQADRDSLSTDEALTIRAEIQGNGDKRLFRAPVFRFSDSLECFEPKPLEEEEYENTEQFVHRANLEYVVLPKVPGRYRLQPEWVYFDPDSNRYLRLKSAQVIDLQVFAGKNYQPPAALADSLSAVPLLEEAPQLGLAERLGRWLHNPIGWGLLAFGLLIWGGLWLWKKRDRPGTEAPKPTAATTRAAEQRQALEPQLSALEDLYQNGQPRPFYDALFKTLQHYLSERLQLPIGQLSPTLLRQRLTEKQAPAIRVQALLSLWQTCEQAIFAGQSQAAHMENHWHSARQLLRDLERDL